MKRLALLLMLTAFVLAGVSQVYASTMTINATLETISWTYSGSGTLKNMELLNGIYIQGDAQNSSFLESFNPDPFWAPDHISYDGTWLKNISGTNTISGTNPYALSMTLGMEGVGTPSSGIYLGQLHEQATSYCFIGGSIYYGDTEPTGPESITIRIEYSYDYSLTQDGTNPFVNAQWHAGMDLNHSNPQKFIDVGWIGDGVNPLSNISEGETGILEFVLNPDYIYNGSQYVAEFATTIDLYANQYGNSISSSSPVPLPGAVWLLGSGLLGLGGWRRFKKG